MPLTLRLSDYQGFILMRGILSHRMIDPWGYGHFGVTLIPGILPYMMMYPQAHDFWWYNDIRIIPHKSMYPRHMAFVVSHEEYVTEQRLSFTGHV